MSRNYKIKYRVDDWNKEIEGESHRLTDGISVIESDPNVGYSDELVIISIVNNDDGSASALVFDTESLAAKPSLKALLLAKEAIEHAIKIKRMH